MIYLGLARGSAYLDYPFYMLLFFGKAKNLQSYLQTTVIAMYMDLSDHRLHTIGGTIVSFEVFWHSFWHLLRWSTRGDDLRFLWETSTGRTGLLSLCLTPLIAWPQLFPFLKRRMSYELRKGLHYLAIVWGVSICFHAPATHILKLMGIPVVIYLADYIYGLFAKTHLVRSTQFRRLETCSEMSFINPPGFKLDGPGYIFLCLPWISKYQWHAFSAFPHVDQPNKTSLWMAAAGGWTRKLHSTISRPTCRPAWIAGPFNSPCGRAIEVDNILAVASGIGITPALALVRMHADTRNVNLIWMCRDASLVEFYLDNVEFDNDAWTLIYYTGQRPLCIKDLPMNVLVFKKRPDLERVLHAVVLDIEEGVGLDQDTNDLISTTSEEHRFQIAVKRVLSTYSREEIFDSATVSTKWESSNLESLKTPRATPRGTPRWGETPTGEGGVRQRPEPLMTLASSTKSAWGGLQPPDAAQPGGLRRGTTGQVGGLKRSGTSAGFKRAGSMASTCTTGGGAPKKASARGVCRAILDMCGEGAPSEDYVLGLLEIPEEEADAMMAYLDYDRVMDNVEEAVDEPSSWLARNEKNQANHGKADKGSEYSKSTSDLESDHFSTVMFNANSKGRARDNPKWPSENSIASAWTDDTTSPLAAAPDTHKWRDDVRSDWQVMYCGGAQRVVDELAKITSKFGLPFSVEKFDW